MNFAIRNVKQYTAMQKMSQSIMKSAAKPQNSAAVSRFSGSAVSEDETLRRRALVDTFDPNSMTGQHIDPEKLELEKAKGERIREITEKLNMGKRLSQEEKDFLREHSPQLYEEVVKIEEEREKFRQELKGAKTPDEAEQLLIQKKTTIMSGSAKNSSPQMMLAAMEDEYKNFMGKGSDGEVEATGAAKTAAVLNALV